MGSTRLRKLAPLWLGLAAVLGSLVLVELGLRHFGSATQTPSGYPVGLFVADEEVGYRMAPGFEGRFGVGEAATPIVINTLGHRDEELRPASKRRARVLALGDSFAFGQGVPAEQSYPEVLERTLRKRVPLEVVNLGVPGYSTLESLALLRAEGDALEPDLVVLGFYVGNDIGFNDVERMGSFVVRSGMLVSSRGKQAGAPGPWTGLRAALNAHLETWRRIEGWRNRRLLRSVTRVQVSSVACRAFEWGTYIALGALRVESSPETESAYACTLAALGELQDTCEQRLGCPLVLVLLPAPPQYVPVDWERLVQNCQLEPSDFELLKPQRILTAWAAERGVDCLDLATSFTAAAAAQPGRRLNLGIADSHFSAAGHRLCGEELAAFLVERGLLE